MRSYGVPADRQPPRDVGGSCALHQQGENVPLAPCELMEKERLPVVGECEPVRWAMGHDYLPYQAREADTIELQKPAVRGKATRLVEMPISWTLDDFPVFEYMRNPNGVQAGLMNAGAVLENWVDDFVYLRKNLDWGILTYTFHPHVIGRGHRMIMLEKLIRKLIELGAEFLTMEDAVAAYQDRRKRS